MTEPAKERRIDRIDRKLGRAWSRLGGVVFVVLGLAMLAEAFGGEGLPDRWPLLLGAATMLVLARLCFRSRSPMSDLLTDGPTGRKAK
ncbi:hypothetical protein GRI89_06735 [Altererythrobacter salegens]|uniref:Uncharacterized protein n=1 Tax=Croceibacterium salegens TaxID=1737568 RepID=A0A6I4STQ1_9SPHN|nr:hypothetical protein [Croceibacterium salegens]MXO59233.1 hypothetical protein [Croceibacterium salegens]